MESRSGLLNLLSVPLKGVKPFGIYSDEVQTAYQAKLAACRGDPAACEMLEHARAVLTHDEAYALYVQIWCGPNLYSVLNLKPGCESVEIKRAYRKMMMRAHVDKRPSNCPCLKKQAHMDSQRVGRAYDVLSNHRALYDERKSFDYNPLDGDAGDDDDDAEYGFGFNDDAFAASGSEAEEVPPGYDAEREEAGKKRRQRKGGAARGRKKRSRASSKRKQQPQPPPPTGPQRIELSCTLRDLYRGCRRRFTFTKGFKTSDGEWFNRSTSMDLHISERTAPGVFQTLKGYGRYNHHRNCCDDLEIVFNVDGNSSTFQCDGSNLTTTVDVGVEEALTGGRFTVTLPDGKEIVQEFTDMLRTGDTKLIAHQGMRVSEKGFGNLTCNIRVVYGDWTTRQRKSLATFLSRIRHKDPAVQNEMIQRVADKEESAFPF